MLLDYAKEYASVPFSEEPLNYLDLLVFSELAFLDLDPEAIGHALPQALTYAHTAVFKEKGSSRIAIKNKEDAQLKELIGASTRYRDTIVRAFETSFEPWNVQFAALSLTLDEVSIIVFRGTDATFTGWREALRLSLESVSATHELATAFLAEQAATSSGPIIACGHSRGGTLATYACLVCDDMIDERIANIVCFDSPGLPRPLRQTPAYERIAGRITTFIPRASMVGNVNHHPQGAVTYIKSKKPYLAQHYPYYWETAGSSFIEAKKAPEAKLTDRAIQAIIDHVSEENKGRIIDFVFGMFGRTGAHTFYDLNPFTREHGHPNAGKNSAKDRPSL